MDVLHIDKYANFYSKLYFMKPDIFYAYLAELKNARFKDNYNMVSPLTFYTYRMRFQEQRDLYNVIESCLSKGEPYELHRVCIFFGKMQDYFFNKDFKLPKTLHRKLPKVLVGIVSEYIPKHFIDLYKTFNSRQKKNLVKWYNYKSKLRSF